MTSGIIALVSASSAEAHDRDLLKITEELDKRSVAWEVVHWHNKSVDWGKFAIAKVQSPWDYVDAIHAFREWLPRAAAATTLCNSLEIIQWNIDKRYLRDVQAAGIEIIPTSFIDNEEDILNCTLLDTDIIVKPAISAGSNDTGRYRCRKEEAFDQCRRILSGGRTVLVQPYITDIDSLGETGLVYIAGKYSHAIYKQANFGDVQQVHNGLYVEGVVRGRTATEAERDCGDKTMAFITSKFRAAPLYARVDMVSSAAGPLIMEVELLEPNLFMQFAEEPSAAAAMADALVAALAAATAE